MALVLRIDVDKPYGNTTFINAVRSKLSEDYYYPNWLPFNINYLKQLKNLLELCNINNISSYIYFRKCTIPNPMIINLIKKGKHKVGIHAENTKSFESFKAEWESISNCCELNFDSFSKHGSGKLKLGKNHYPPYEPEKYIEWAKKLGIQFKFGNDLCTSQQDFIGKKDFYPKIFWMEQNYRDKHFAKIENVIEVAKDNLVPILIHPSNFDSTKNVKNDFINLINLAKQNNIKWIL